MFKTRDMGVSLLGPSTASGERQSWVEKERWEKFHERWKEDRAWEKLVWRKESHVTHLQECFNHTPSF
jgi:hypothetical protein